ncbi:MAG: penicillin-binding protein 1C [Bacteroidota bacterium]
MLGTVFIPLPKEDFAKSSVHSLRVTDCNGILLREFLNDQQGRGQWRPLSALAPFLQQATIAAEDKRFRIHPGVDPLAITRAVIQDIVHGSMRSGGSGITQQVIRNVYHHPRTILYKLLEAWYALRLERMMTKDEILEQYLNRAPYGNQLFGAEAAARYYFQKPAENLSIAESAFLAALPNAPSKLNPYVNFPAVKSRQQLVLRRTFDQKRLSQEEYDRAREQPIVIAPPEVNFRAPHAVEMAVDQFRGYPEISTLRTTIDYPLQQRLQLVVRNQLSHLEKKHVTNAAVVVIENSTGAVRALIGSADFFDEEHEGQVNGSLALRQPGSALKPFTYGLAFESGMSASEILPDIPLQIPDVLGDYVPENYDKKYHGPVRARTALACSYNIPAVHVLRNLGVVRLHERLRLAGLTSLTEPPGFYGYGLTLGNADVRLLELASAYASFARGGVWKPWTIVESSASANSPREFRVYEEESAFLVTDILRDPVARRPAFGNAFRFPFQCAVKTGTTKDYRDNWTMGYTSEYTVGVWAGNFDGTPMRGVSGVAGAGGIFFDIMMTIYDQPYKYPSDFRIPPGFRTERVCAVSGDLPNSSCGKTVVEWFAHENIPTKRCAMHQLYRVVNEDGAPLRRVFEILPPEYRSWALERRIPTPPPGALRLNTDNTPESSRDKTLAIISPANGEVFKIDPVLRREYQAIKIAATIPPASRSLRMRVDEDQVLPFDANGVWWELKKGRHQFQVEAVVEGRRITSEVVRVEVE